MNAPQANDTPDKVRDLQRALYRAAKASPTRRFHALYDKLFRSEVLERAWQEVQANPPATGPLPTGRHRHVDGAAPTAGR